MESKVISRHLNRLLLDPNNYRFIDHPDYKKIDDSQVSDIRIQQRTYNLLVGKFNENITDLISSFKKNGILKLDPIQVKAIGDNYIVVEGNRRTAALKYLYEEYKRGNDVGILTEIDFKSIEIVETDGDEMQHLITMGLYHISGKKRWSPVNQAQLIHDLIYKYGQQEKDICDSLSISKHILRRSLRTLALIELYKKSDYGDQFETNKYSIFEEIIKKIEMKSWLQWNDDELKPDNIENQDRLFSWISTEQVIERDEDGEEQTITKEPIITKSHEIRDLSKFINDSKAIEKMEDSRSISQGFALSDSIGDARLHNALDSIRNEIQVAFYHSEFMTPADYDEIAKFKDKLDRLIPSSQALIQINEKKAAKYFDQLETHFTHFEISSYRKIEKLTIKNLKRVNIFAGGNNLGKTSILEAFYLLSQLNDINAFLNLEKFRGKFITDFHSKWLDKNFVNEIKLSGTFNNIDTYLNINSETTQEDIEKTAYLSTIIETAIVNNTELSSSIHLFADQMPEQRYIKSQILCSGAFTTPYRYNEKLLHSAHKIAVDNKYFDKIINFIKEHLDESIQRIELVNDEGENRFKVLSSDFDKAIDLTKYGEGLQRVFEIALLLGYCKNGILCIDEVDSAIHKNLLIEFTKFIQQIAEEFNVQVFLSTHSKECIDAFVENKYLNDQLSAYSLSLKDGKVNCEYIDGLRLERLIENINLDIR